MKIVKVGRSAGNLDFEGLDNQLDCLMNEKLENLLRGVGFLERLE